MQDNFQKVFTIMGDRQQQKLVTEEQTARPFDEPAGDPSNSDKQGRPSNAKVFPDIRFPDGRMMVWDYDLAKYTDAPVGYQRNDVSPFVMGKIYVFPYPGDSYIPTDDELKRRRKHVNLQWWETMLWLRHVVRAFGVSAAIMGIIWIGAYIVEVIKAFRVYGAPKVAAAFGDILAVVVYIIAAAIGILLLATLFSGRSTKVDQPVAGSPAPAGGMDQNIQINIGGQQFNAGGDAAQKFINNI